MSATRTTTQLPVPERSSTLSSATFGNPATNSQASMSQEIGNSQGTTSNRSSFRVPRPPKSSTPVSEVDDSTWGSNFWVTLVDPQTQTPFFACPATGQVSWDPPVGNFVLPPSTEGEWWELIDESRGLPYYYHTKTGETIWERPEAFVIPLGIIQNTTLGRRLSTTFTVQPRNSVVIVTPDQPIRPSKSFRGDQPSVRYSTNQHDHAHARNSQLVVRSNGSTTPATKSQASSGRRPSSNDSVNGSGVRFQGTTLGQYLPPIPDVTDRSTPPSPVSPRSRPSTPVNSDSAPLETMESPSQKEVLEDKTTSPQRNGISNPDSISRTRAKSSPYTQHQRPPHPQSLNAAVELLTGPEKRSFSESSHSHVTNGSTGANDQFYSPNRNYRDPPPTPSKKKEPPPSPRRPAPTAPVGNFWRSASSSSIAGKEISPPILNHEATLNMSPMKNRGNGKPIPVQSRPRATPTATLNSGTHPILPQDLAMDIQQFSESEYAKKYFSTHRAGFIFRRRVPVAQMMTWQKAPLTSPLLTLNRSLGKEAVKIFKVIQRIMGDRERDRSVGVRLPGDNHVSTVPSVHNGSTISLPNNMTSVLEEERWLLGEGLAHGELRDEIYCQLMKQLSGNSNPESVFRGMQLFCVLLVTFPPSKNFETYLQSYMQQKTTQQQSRVDVMAKYCLRRLVFITKKGPRGKPPSIAEIETASDAAFNPSTFGESLDTSIRLQERNYPGQKVPIILPFLSDGILALGGTKSEGIFRVPGDGDSVSELKLRIDRGYYTLDGVDDPYVLASLMKLWLRELCDPLVPDEMYNECISSANEPEACVRIVERLPTINRRVILFVISFLQLFLEERVQRVTKMTPANLALVMAPNLLRCNSESMAVVFTNAQFEQLFVYHLLLHLKCNQVDPVYIPTHGLGAVPSSPQARTSKTRLRRNNH